MTKLLNSFKNAEEFFISEAQTVGLKFSKKEQIENTNKWIYFFIHRTVTVKIVFTIDTFIGQFVKAEDITIGGEPVDFHFDAVEVVSHYKIEACKEGIDALLSYMIEAQPS